MIDRRFTADIVAGLIVNRGGVRGGERDRRGGQLRLRTRLDLQACKIGKDWVDDGRRQKQEKASTSAYDVSQWASLAASHLTTLA